MNCPFQLTGRIVCCPTTPLSRTTRLSSLKFTLIGLQVDATEPFSIARHGRVRNCHPLMLIAPWQDSSPSCHSACPQTGSRSDLDTTAQSKWDFICLYSMPYDDALHVCISVSNQPDLSGKLRPRSSCSLPFSSARRLNLLMIVAISLNFGNSPLGPCHLAPGLEYFPTLPIAGQSSPHPGTRLPVQ